MDETVAPSRDGTRKNYPGAGAKTVE